ncbi:MAG: hypothetical protein CMM07_05195 [Rhodopirellula sp.]|nr:hypothetical protein [Rhodopirellula sp.]
MRQLSISAEKLFCVSDGRSYDSRSLNPLFRPSPIVFVTNLRVFRVTCDLSDRLSKSAFGEVPGKPLLCRVHSYHQNGRIVS